MFQNQRKKVTVGSVRARIMIELRKGPKRFKEITKNLGLHDFVANRELKKLQTYGWARKEGTGKSTLYKLGETDEVKDILRRLDVTPEPNDKLYPVRMDLYNMSSEVYKNRSDQSVEFTLPRLDIVIAGKKIDGFEDSVKQLEKNYHALAVIAKFMNNIVRSRATKKMLNYRAEIEKEGRKIDAEADLEAIGVYLETFQDELKLIISWRPERYGPLESCPLPEYMYRH